ncbi:hypothetical protein BDZ94DRAFT_1381618 [Collybia nuda]|uniref:Ubiquitin-like protease family profile domain-containing protein n=1 Tax=Collybia nuda TaxID=64659 RepID=A0A9P5XZM3_9AGAR|nr:hypothetical protein BDZ94DRAFT_1381618 [Collybia nuda]
MSEDPNFINLADDPVPQLNQDIWIGHGREWPEDPKLVPRALNLYRSHLLEVPEYYNNKAFPKANIIVEKFIETNLLTVSYSLVAVKPNLWFNVLPPNQDEKVLLSRPVPSRIFVQKAKEVFGQAILDGNLSIQDPSYSNSRLPLWTVQFWTKAHEVKDAQLKWKKALDWFDTKFSDGNEELRSATRRRLLALRWNELTNIPGAGNQTTTQLFASLLSADRMSDVLVDMMFSHLSERAEGDPTLDNIVIIETLRFMNDINKATKKEDHNTPLTSLLKRLEDRIKETQSDTLLFPIFLEKEKHWLTFKIDFRNSELSYGDSLSHRGMAPPKQATKKLKWWLGKRFNSAFVDLGDSLEHGSQEDGTECGLLATNTAAHETFHDTLWTCERKILERVEWFNKLFKAHIDYAHGMSIALLLNPASPSKTQNHVHRPILIQPKPTPASLLFSPTSSTSPLLEKNDIRADTDCWTETMDVDSGATELMGGPDAASAEVGIENPINERAGIPNTFSVQKKEKLVKIDSCVLGKGKKRGIDSVDGAEKTVGKVSRSVSGLSSSAIWERLQNKTIKPLAEKDERSEEFKLKILGLDKYAEIQDAKHVRHLKCGKILIMKYNYSTNNFKTHVANCTGPPKSAKLPGGGMQSLSIAFQKQTQASALALSSPKTRTYALPCPGLEGTSNPKVLGYLNRTGALGGGASSVSVLSQQLYGKRFVKLSTHRKAQVKLAQKHEWLWRNDQDSEHVYSIDCQKFTGSKAAPCVKCRALLQKKRFQNALNVPQPVDQNYKYVNHEYRNKNLAILFGRSADLRPLIEGDSTTDSPLMMYVRGVMSGKYKGDDFFATLIQAMVIKRDKQERGVGMQNFKYAPDLVEFSHIMLTHSPRAYESLRNILPIPDPRSLKVHTSRLPAFPRGIQDRTFQLVKDHLKMLEYTGPVALSCDDTKLLASFRPYYDKELEGYYIIGHIGEPYQLANAEEFLDVVKNGNLQKATKLRLWCLQVPLPKVPTIVVAAMGISNSETAADLFPYLWRIVSGLLERDIQLTSYAADGSNVERGVQKILETKATTTVTHRIKHPSPDGKGEDIIINIPFFGKYPIANLQDSKHLLKTFRNNLYSGARLLTFPNSVAMFSQIREIAFTDNSPLFHRDVEKLDRQDDNAATRLFCADTLAWVNEHHPEELGLSMYLFVFGELIDAYQNRSVDITERIEMVLRAYFFVEMWEKFLKVAGYSKAKHFVSQQCEDITDMLIKGFMKLHIFGLCRQIVKDFTEAQIKELIPKLSVKLREAIFLSRTANGKGRASGYSHTYHDVHGIDLVALAAYPTDMGIVDAAVRAFGHAESFFGLLGVSAADLNTDMPPQIPVIKSWYQEEVLSDAEDMYTDILCDIESDDESDTEDFQSTIDSLEGAEMNTLRGAEAVMTYRYTSIALSVDDGMKIAALPELEGDELVEARSDEASYIARTLASLRAPTSGDNRPSNMFQSVLLDPSSVDLSELVKVRFSHQTAQATSGIRTSRKGTNPHTASSVRQDMLRVMHNIVKQQGEIGVSTGAERALRWGHTNTAIPTTGNAANAAAAAATSAGTVSSVCTILSILSSGSQ